MTENELNFVTLSRTPYQGLTLKNAEIGICTSAQIQRISLEKYIETYVVRCYRKEYDIKGFTGHNKTIRNILTKYSQNCNLTSDNEDDSLSNDSPEFSYSASQPSLTIPKAQPGNINYFANNTHPLIGRDDEEKRLIEFLQYDPENSEDSRIAWFQLAGVAGQGKSRLAFNLISELTKEDLIEKLGLWRAGFLTDSDINSFEDCLNEWEPSKHHLLIFDYVIGREKK